MRQLMNLYEVCTGDGYVEVVCDRYYTSDGMLEMITKGEDGSDSLVATFKDWEYVTKMAWEGNK